MGKATQAEKLRTALVDHEDLRAVVRASPDYQTHFGLALGEYLNGKLGTLDQVHPKLSGLLYLENMREGLPELNDLLACNDVVILDRYVPSTIAYQAGRAFMLHGYQAGLELEAWLIRTAEMFSLPRPHLVIQFTGNLEISETLVAKKGKRVYTDRAADIHEANQVYLSSVQQWYNLSSRGTAMYAERWERIDICDSTTDDGIAPIEVVADEVYALVTDFLRDRKASH